MIKSAKNGNLEIPLWKILVFSLWILLVQLRTLLPLKSWFSFFHDQMTRYISYRSAHSVKFKNIHFMKNRWLWPNLRSFFALSGQNTHIILERRNVLFKLLNLDRIVCSRKPSTGENRNFQKIQKSSPWSHIDLKLLKLSKSVIKHHYKLELNWRGLKSKCLWYS